MAIGVSLGIVLAVMRTSKGFLLRPRAPGFLWFFRGTPLLVQLIFWFNLGALLPQLSLGIPFGPAFMTAETNSVISPSMAALLGLGLNEAAYMAEVVRAGLFSVDEGQVEASQALGMRPDAHLATDRDAAGDAGDHPTHRQPDHSDVEDLIAGERARIA